MTLIHDRVQKAQSGENPFVIVKLKSGWVVIGDVQPLDGYCLLLADPVVGDINSLDEDNVRKRASPKGNIQRMDLVPT